jgi:hypothetical protein
MMPALERGHGWFTETDMRTLRIPSLAMAAGLAAATALGGAGASVAAPAYGNVAVMRATTAGNVMTVEEPGPAPMQRDSASGGGGLAPGILPCVASGTPPGGPPTRLTLPAYYGCPPYALPRVKTSPPPIVAVRPHVQAVRPHVQTEHPSVGAVRPRVHTARARVHMARSDYWRWFGVPGCDSAPQFGACAAAWYPR